MQEVDRYAPEDVLVVVCACKTDLVQDRTVSQSEAQVRKTNRRHKNAEEEEVV